ncbi:hypothetical protein E3N88_20084 [Mikania micrantha]|uniref:Uncharacterized protein n=1 Tax=Mikania micrantha TaxID=192012 RepID=A0A5N6NG00_9ASTR|nr:hypothetical protein E3N88_20084 [Mikania micrantha]
MPTPSAQLDSINNALIHVVGCKHVVIGSVELQIPSEQVATLHQSKLIHHSVLISDSLGVADDTGRPNFVDRTRFFFPFPYQTSFGLLTGKGDGPLVLGQGEPKSVNTPTLMERGLPVCSNKIHSVPFLNSGSIPMKGSASKGDGPLVLGQGEPKSVNTPTLMERGLPVCSNKIHSVPFLNSGSIPMKGSAKGRLQKEGQFAIPISIEAVGKRLREEATDLVTGGVVDVRRKFMAKALTFQSIRDDVLLQVSKYKEPKDVWDALWARFLEVERVQKARSQTLKESLGSSLDEKGMVRKYVNSMPPKYLPIMASIEQYSEIENMAFRFKAYEELKPMPVHRYPASRLWVEPMPESKPFRLLDLASQGTFAEQTLYWANLGLARLKK